MRYLNQPNGRPCRCGWALVVLCVSKKNLSHHKNHMKDLMPKTEEVNITSGFNPPLITSSVLIKFSNSCDPRPLNFPDEAQNRSPDEACIALLVLAALAVFLETLALTVLIRPSANRFKSMKLSLIALTSVEMWLNSTIFIHKAWETFITMHYESFYRYWFSFVLFSLLNTALCSRNWMVTLITLARCEAITRPMAARVSTHIFSPRRQLIYLGGLIFCSVVLSTFRLVVRPIIVCTNLNSKVLSAKSERFARIGVISEKVFFAYQSAIPITIVTITTLFMIVILLRRKIPTDWWDKRGSYQRGRSNYFRWKGKVNSQQVSEQDNLDNDRSSLFSIKIAIPAYRLSSQVRATRFILLIASVFIVCEAPVFFAVIFMNHMQPSVRIPVYTYLRFLIILDSYANFVIYLLLNRPYRVELINLLRFRSKPKRQSSPCTVRSSKINDFAL